MACRKAQRRALRKMQIPDSVTHREVFRMPRFSALTLSFALLFAGLLHAQSAPDFSAAQVEAVTFLGELVKIDTSNPPGSETRAAEYMKSMLAAEGVTANIYESAPGRGNLVARLKGNGR